MWAELSSAILLFFMVSTLGVTQQMGWSGGSKIHVSIALVGWLEGYVQVGLPVRAATHHLCRAVRLLPGPKCQDVSIARLLLT